MSRGVIAAVGIALLASLGALACANGAPTPPGFIPAGDDASATDGTTGGAVGDAGADAVGMFGDGAVTASTLVIQPADPVVDVSIDNGVVTVTPVDFVAIANGSTQVTASWTLDRGDLGPIGSGTGVFSASGLGAGVGHVTAQYGTVIAQTSVTVNVRMTQNGGASSPDAGAGGVGGTGPGSPVSGGTQGVLTGPATPPASAAELGWLYPYDKTVWPRGLLAPLLQWQTTHATTAVYIHAKAKYYEFKGFYGGTQLVNQPFDEQAWATATGSNAGDPLHVELTITDGTKTVGPIAEDWTIAPGELQGTVYYDSYNTQLAPPLPGQSTSAAIIAIQPAAAKPALALPQLAQTQCVVCHELSGDGSTMFAEFPGGDAYSDGASYDLKNGGAAIASYLYGQLAPDGTTNDRKFVWSAVYPDGTFAMAGSNYAREAYFDGPSQLFARSNGSGLALSGWDNSTMAAMPSFSADGKALVFNFWSGTATNGVAPGGGRTLDVVDFSCGAQNGGTACGAPPYTTSNLREIYRETSASRYPGWPAFLPNDKFVVFHDSIQWDTMAADTCTATPTPGTTQNCMFTTWKGAQAELWMVDVPAAAGGKTSPIPLAQLNGSGYLPKNAQHPNDAVLNYEPTVNPIATGGYYWVVFTSRRMYGNVAAGDPYDGGDGAYPIPKKLWVAAIDLNPTAGKDPSHPAFYLPGQELNAGNMRGHWVVNPCKQNGSGCSAGDQCCSGFCRQQDDAGGLVCTNQPMGCSQQYEKCTTTDDCCGKMSGFSCINGYCVAPAPK
jgi:hypothetical protein